MNTLTMIGIIALNTNNYVMIDSNNNKYGAYISNVSVPDYNYPKCELEKIHGNKAFLFIQNHLYNSKVEVGVNYYDRRNMVYTVDIRVNGKSLKKELELNGLASSDVNHDWCETI